ncbi:hypothetical protein ALC53_04849 [Atta colombica]|uniref:Uncharacterized protein n=1 Tax=Atta colombica TaxID=520822 RepID=A0A195BIY9_9HYME|nr:hypothetical protein ALC53_04849 [Atta colombica]
MLLLKQKMCKTDILIKQYTQNMKEVENLKSNLEIAKKEAKHIISDYSSAKDEIRELKCKIVKYEQSNEKLTNKINDYNINIAADKQSIQQLTCKIKELEEEQSAKIMEHNLDKSSFEDKIKELEHELKMLKKDDISTVTKKGGKKKEKKIISTDVDTSKQSISIKSTSDIGINVSLCNIESSIKCEVRDQNIMTDEFYHTKNNPHPLFCEKCEAHLSPELTPEKIFKTMVACPKLIEKDLPPSPKKIYSPPCHSLSNTYLDFTNRNEDSLSKISSIPHLCPYSPYSDSIAGNIKSQSGRSSTMTQICENVELRNTDISHIPLVTNIPSNLNAIPTLSQNNNCAREHFCSDDLLVKHSISIKKMKRKIQSLKSKMKKFRRLKKKIDTNSRCRCVMNHKDDISLNSNLISLICKGVAEYFNEKKEACPKNERDIDSEKCICCSKRTELKRRQSCNAYKSMFSKIENFDENERVRDTCCDKTENATNIIDVLQFNHTSKNILSSVHKNSYSNINISSTSLNDIEIDKELLHKQNTLHSVEVVPVENNFTMSRLSIDKLYVNNDILNKNNVVDANDVDNQTETGTIEIYASDDLFGKNNVKAIDMDNQIEARTIFLSNDTNSTYHAYSKIDVNAEENKIKTKDQNINEDKLDEIHASDNLLSKSNVETTDTNNQTETRTILLPNNENSTIDGKIVDINADKIEIKRKCQNIYKDELKINTSDNILNQDNVEIVDMDSQTKTRMISNNENSTDLAHNKSIVINVEKRNIMRKGQNIQKAKVGDRLLKNLRNLKRKKQSISRLNKQENIKSYSDHNFENLELAKKPRIENEKEINDSSLNHIKNLKRNLDIQAESTNKQTDDKLCSNHYEPKKVRIAHTPKMSVHQLSVNRNNSTHCTIRNIAILATLAIRQKNNVNQQLNIDKDNSLIESKKNPIINKKCDEENVVKSIETNSIDERLVNEKNLNLMNIENSLQNNDITPPAINIEHAELAKCDDVIEDTTNKNISIDRVVGETLNNSDESNVVHNNIVNDINEMNNARNIQEKTCISNRVIKMQAIEIKTQNKNLVMNQRNKKMELVFVPHNFEESQAPISRLYKYINKKKCTKKHKLSCKEIKYAYKITDKFVKKQLRRLMNSDWKDSIYDSIHDDIKVKLKNTCGPRIIAKCIVEFIIDEVDHTEALDKSFTPPAPLMTKFEQKIVTLLFDLEASKPMVIYFVQAAIEFHMFRLDSDVKDPIDSLTRIYVVLSRIQKDREKVRMMCCSALYCMNLKSIAVLNTILMCWSEVLPNAETNKEILSKCIAFLINSLHISTDKDRILKKLKHLKSLVSRCHNYTSETVNDIVKELMTALKAKRIEGLDTAIILVAKREKAQWTYKNIIESVLLPMIISNQHPCIYSAFSLLGRLLRAFPLQDKNQIVHDISEQLCVLIQSGQGSHDQQEGIISALLSLSRQKFDVISWPVIKWTPSKSLRPIVDTQLQTFLHTRTSKFWKEYLQKKNIKLIQSKT